MLLQEWLEELRENVLRDVSDVLGSSSVELWSDATLVRYLDEGYKKFCKGTLLLRDATTPAVTQVILTSGTDTYPLHKSVLSVISARLDGNAYDLRKTTHDALAGAVDNSVSSGAAFAAAAAQEPVRFTADEANRVLRVYPTVGETLDGRVLHLRVARMPLKPLTTDDLDVEPEVSDDYHLDIVEWGAYRALRNHDTDAEGIAKASAHKRRFEEAVKEAQAASRRSLFAPVEFVFNSRW